MQTIIAPHGGKLVDRILTGEAKAKLLEKIPGMTRLILNRRELADLEMIATGAFSPLEGYVNSKDYESILHSMHLTNGLPWTIPITLSIEKENAGKLKVGQDHAMYDLDGGVLGVLHLDEIYPYDKQREALQIYKTDDIKHPGVKANCHWR